MTNQLFAAALGITAPWFVETVDFNAGQRRLTIHDDFVPGSRFAHPKAACQHKVHDTQVKRLRHLNFFQHECYPEVRVPRVKLPDGKVALVEPDWVGKLAGFTLLFEAPVLMLAQQMPFAAVARTIGESWHRVHAICRRYVDLTLAGADLSALSSVAIDETSYRHGHSYLTLVADADATHGYRSDMPRERLPRLSYSRADCSHVCMGTHGLEGAFEAMGTGDVDVNLAKSHHSDVVAHGVCLTVMSASTFLIGQSFPSRD